MGIKRTKRDLKADLEQARDLRKRAEKAKAKEVLGGIKLKKQALAICRKPLPYWDMVKELRALGVNLKRAKRMAARAKHGVFMWEGVKFALHDPESKPLTKKQVRQYRKGDVPDDEKA